MKKRQSKVTKMKRELITPAKAKRFLKSSWVTQRSINEAVVKTYVEEMKAGRWNDTPHISFDEDNLLVDGHHRLYAIIRSGKSVWLWVARGLSKIAVLALDTGHRRSVSFQLRVEEERYGMKKLAHKSSRSSYLSMCNYLLATCRVRISHSTAWRTFYSVFGEEVDWAISECLSHPLLSQGTVGGALAFAYPTNPEKVKEFAAALRNASSLPARHPARVLLVHLMSLDPTDHSSTYRFPVAKRVLNALLAFIEGRDVRAVTDGTDGRDYFARAYTGDAAVMELFRPWMPKNNRAATA